MPSEVEIGNYREALKKVYTGKEWQKKVNKMPASQVTAIYLRLKKQGKI